MTANNTLCVYSVTRFYSVLDFCNGNNIGVFRSVEFFKSLSEAQSACDCYRRSLGFVFSENGRFCVLNRVLCERVTDFFPVCD